MRGPTAAAAASTSSRPVASSTSQRTGTAPEWSTASAEAMNVCAGTITSSPAPIPAAWRLIESAAVPEATPTQSAVEQAAAHVSSKRPTSSPRMNELRRTTRSKASSSSSVSFGVLAIERRERHLHGAAVPMLRPDGRRAVMGARVALRSVRHRPNRNKRSAPISSATDGKGTNRDCLRGCRDRKVGGCGRRADKLRPASSSTPNGFGRSITHQLALPRSRTRVLGAASPPSRCPLLVGA